MSAAVRTTLAAAANTVPGLKVTDYYRQTTSAGTGCVRLDRTEYPNRLGGVDHWQVVIFLPQRLGDAEKWLDAHRAALYAALDGELSITSIQMQQIIFEAGTALPCAVIAGHRESE